MKKLTSVLLFIIMLCGLCVMPVSAYTEIDYSCYEGKWDWDQGGSWIKINSCTDTAMNFNFVYGQFAVTVTNAQVDGTSVYGEYYEVWDDGVNWFNYILSGDFRMSLGDSGIWVDWTSSENGSAPSTLGMMFNKPNFQLKTHTIEENNITVTMNGTQLEFDQPPIMQNDRVLVPMRLIFEALGATVEWDEYNQYVKATKGKTNITMQIGNSTMMKNGESITLDMAPILQNGRTLVPVRAVAESLGAIINWEDNTNTVVITTQDTTINTQLVTEQLGENIQWIRAINGNLYIWDKKNSDNIFRVWEVNISSGNCEQIAYAKTTPYCYSNDWIIFCGSQDGLTQKNIKYHISDENIADLNPQFNGYMSYQDGANTRPMDGFYQITGDYLLYYEYFEVEGKTGVELMMMNLFTDVVYSFLNFEEQGYWWTGFDIITDKKDPNTFYMRLKHDIQSGNNGQMRIDGLYKFDIQSVQSDSDFEPEIYAIPEMFHTVIPLNKKIYLISDTENPWGSAGIYLAEMLSIDEMSNFEKHFPRLLSKYYCKGTNSDHGTYSDGTITAYNCWIENDAIYFRPVEPYNEQLIKIQDENEEVLNIGNKYMFDGILSNDEVWYNNALDSKGNKVLGAYENGKIIKSIYFSGIFLTQDDNYLYYYGYPYEPRRNEYNEFLDKQLGPKGIYKVGY